MSIRLSVPRALAAALLCLGAVDVGAQAVEIDFSRFKWRSLSPKDTASRYAILHVDSISGATQMVYSLPSNTTWPCHWHSASQGSVVAQGSEKVERAGVSEGATLGIGGYSFVPSRMPFRLRTGRTWTIVLASLDGPFDIRIAPDEQCQSTAPIAAGSGRAFESGFPKVAWTEFPTKDSGVQISILHNDSTSGVTHMLFPIPPNATSRCHWHSRRESNFIVEGSAGMRHAGMAERAGLEWVGSASSQS
jgi:hypothetical protein